MSGYVVEQNRGNEQGPYTYGLYEQLNQVGKTDFYKPEQLNSAQIPWYGEEQTVQKVVAAVKSTSLGSTRFNDSSYNDSSYNDTSITIG